MLEPMILFTADLRGTAKSNITNREVNHIMSIHFQHRSDLINPEEICLIIFTLTWLNK